MIRYKQYRPAFFEGFENEKGTVSTLEELLAIPFIQNFTTTGPFHRFSLSDHSYEGRGHPMNLMAEYKEGREWWVVALLWSDADELAALPKWVPVD